ncbi:MAG TPA: peptidase T [Solirubrobacteraceae bacterium]|nr:peptidase T [Solirubrobacteraceae bacterium]
MAGTQGTAPFTSELAEELAPAVTERLIRYARVETQAVRARTTCPSSPGQLELLRMLEEELRSIGLEDASTDENGYLFATLPANVEGAPVVGLLAHVDVSPDAPAEGVEPLVHRGYDGQPLTLPKGGTVLDPARMPELARAIGHDVVTSSGDTLLGADDKAGVAEIMSAVAYLAAHPELPRPTIRVGFLPDEEIGEGAALFDHERFGARCAYTLDGSELGELQDETFTGSEVTVKITGVEVHPGWAKGRMVNAARLAGRILAELPADLSPERTEGREGFIHPYEVNATGGEATIVFIVRDFEEDLLEQHIQLIRDVAERVGESEPRATVEVTVRKQYPNMRDHLAPFPEVVGHAEEALRREGITAVRTPIRGGTDGSTLSANGLPTPNLFTGGHEYHSVREWASVQEMAAASAVAVRLAGVWAESAEA